jgi:molybdopterin converting factor small subunit
MPTLSPTIRILLFATAREAVGRPVIEWDVPQGGVTAADLVRRLAAEYPRLRPALKTSRFVRNGQYLARLSGRVRPGDEFAVHPPYGGG